MASPDTEELATVPLPTPAPDVETAPQQVTDPAAAAAETAPQEALTGPAEAQPSAAGAAGIAEPGADERAVSADEQAAAAGRVAAAGADEVPSPETVEQAAAKPAKQGGRWWRGFTGSLAAGLTVLAIGVLVVAGVCVYTDAPGPGPVLLIGHPVAAVLALLAQRVADRRNGLPAAGAGIAVVLFVVSALTLFWLT